MHSGRDSQRATSRTDAVLSMQRQSSREVENNQDDTGALERTSFDELPLAVHLKETIKSVGFTHPTPIQRESIPYAVEGRDILGIAQTGSGKTAAYVLPILHRLRKTKNSAPHALILAPTRELAEQIHEVITTLAPRTGLRSMTIYGGMSHARQIATLRTRPHIIVACPGRLLDHIRGGSISLNEIQALVLDEADRMFDMGFLPDIRRILEKLPKERQTMLFSATMPAEIENLCLQILHNPHTVKVAMQSPVATVTHSMFGIGSRTKQGVLVEWLETNPDAYTVVFTKMKHTAKRLAEKLAQEGFSATSLHGNLSQGARTRALSGFKDGRYRIMIATDIAARGIDVDGITHVIHYDMPESLDSYIHRSGRAGRAQRTGDAIAFVTTQDRGILHTVERWLKAPLTLIGGETLSTAASHHTSKSPNGRSPQRAPGGRTSHNRTPRDERVPSSPQRDRGAQGKRPVRHSGGRGKSTGNHGGGRSRGRM